MKKNPKKKKDITKYVIKKSYIICRMIEGLLKEPIINYEWGNGERIFPPFNSIKEAEEAFLKSKEYGKFVIITVLEREIDWDYEEEKQNRKEKKLNLDDCEDI